METGRFIGLYALAWVGGVIAYTPLLTILLPVRVAKLAGPEASIDWMAYVALTGAIAASIGGIGFGYMSDITRNRRSWILAGLIFSCLLLPLMGQVTNLAELIALIIFWQLALNMMLGPLAAWASDCVPDHQKGLLGGMMAFAPGLGALTGAIVTQPGLASDGARLWIVIALVAACVLPILFVGEDRIASAQPAENAALRRDNWAATRRKRALWMWLARLLVQLAEAAMFAYLFLWLLSLDPNVSDNHTASLFSIVMLASAPLALIAGRWSDKRKRPIAPLQLCAALAALGLAAMGLATDLRTAMWAYAFFGIFGAVFLALHSAQTLRLLPQPDRRGRDLGLFNLANTLPSMVMPWLAMAMIPIFGFGGLFAVLAILAGVATILLFAVARTDTPIS